MSGNARAAEAVDPTEAGGFSGGPPGWLDSAAPPGRLTAFDVTAEELSVPVPVQVWSPAGVPDDERLPLLVVHDGPAYDEQASLTHYLAAGVAGQWLPPLRAALLGPGQRERWYSASPAYRRALATAVLPAITGRVATSTRVAMGASLGALAMLHAHCRYPGAFDGLFLQSGSFFWPSFDSQERGFRYYQRIIRFTAAVRRGGLLPRPVPVVLTCGRAEENLANNRLMATMMRDQGYPATLHEVAGLHNFPAWRDAFEPGLTQLLVRLSG